MSAQFSKVRYSPLDGESFKHGIRPPRLRTRFRLSEGPIWWVYLALWTVLVALGGFTAGKMSFGRGLGDDATHQGIQLATTMTTFKYNRTFAEAPSNLSNGAWRDIFPRKGTYFSHPTIAPHRATLSVFHQLHCVGYWAIYKAAMSGKQLSEDELPMMSSPPHVRHCLDLLRQSLMCNADATIEEKDEEAGGVHGFGIEHECKNWDQLTRWVSNQQQLRD